MSSHQAVIPEVLEPGVRRMEVAEDSSERFVAAMLDLSPTEGKRRSPAQLAVSVVVHFLLISAVIIAPLYLADNSLDLKAMTTTFLVAPPPPAPPPPPAATVQQAQKVTQVALKTFQVPLTAPKAIPKTVAVIADEAPPSAGAGALGGVTGGVAGGVLGGLLSASAALPPPPPVAVTKPQIVRVGGDVRPPRLVSQVQPVYSPIARTARIEGDVVVDAVIDAHGNVVKAHAVSGPGVLIPAALAAVQQWKYAPTYLNGEAVSVGMNVVVQFRLHNQS